MKVYIDGQLYDKADAKISVFDHGLLYGDGIFGGLRIYNRRVFRLSDHLDRFYDNARAILLDVTLPKQELQDAIINLCRVNNLNEGYIRLVATRGVGDLGISPKKCGKASLVIIADSIVLFPKEVYEQGLRMITAPTRRNSHAMVSPTIKSLNYLNNIFAKIEANHVGADDAIMLNQEGHVVECSAMNLFGVKNGKLFTPTTSSGALAGITRRTVLEICEEMQLSAAEVVVTRYDLFTADELFATGTGGEIAPIRELDGRPIGTGKPGPITLKILQRFRELAKTNGVPIPN